jgi:multimeric flavodoxin WrbA
MTKVKVLGIAGSPRHGNTDILVKEVLSGASELPNVETEFISLADKKILGGCKVDLACFKNPSVDLLCKAYKDDVNDIVRKMIASDGIIVGSPVYWGTVTGQLKLLIDRTMPVEALGYLLRNKVGGAVAVATDRQGGQEGTLLDILKWFMIHDMIVVGVGAERPEKGVGSYWGVAGVRGYPYAMFGPGSEQAVKQDVMAMAAAPLLGKRVAEVAKVVKNGFSNLPRNETAWPAGPLKGLFDNVIKKL